MDLGLTTVAAIIGFALAVASALLLISWLQHRSLTALGLWGTAFALGGVATALVSARGQISDLVSIVAANALLAVAYGMIWSAARLFDGRRPLVLASLAGAGVWLVAMLPTGWYHLPGVRVPLMVVIGMVYTLLAAAELWRASGDGLYSRWPAIGLLVLHAAALPLRIPALAGQVGGGHSSANLMTLILFESILLAMAGAYLFGSLVRERVASGYKHAASIDPLTGVANRRAFLQKGGRLVQRARARGGTHSLLLFDLDRFKAINDEFGHAAGDAVLTTFCEVATEQLRPTDLFGRIGGEEFACLLVGVSAADAALIAERVRFAFEAADHASGEQIFGATVSVGLATAAAEQCDLTSLLLSADRALYRAKKDGRNRVVEEEPLQGSPESGLGSHRADAEESDGNRLSARAP